MRTTHTLHSPAPTLQFTHFSTSQNFHPILDAASTHSHYISTPYLFLHFKPLLPTVALLYIIVLDVDLYGENVIVKFALENIKISHFSGPGGRIRTIKAPG